MNKNLLYGVAGTIGIVVLIVTSLVFFVSPSANTKQSDLIRDTKTVIPPTADVKEQTVQQLSTMNLRKIINASNPSISVNQDTGTVYASFVKTESQQTNVYLMISNDDGKTFSEPTKVNDVSVAAQMWNTIPIRFGPNDEIYVAWMTTAEHPDFPWGITEIRISKSTDGGKTFEPSVNPVRGDASEKAFFDLAVSDTGALYLSYLDSMTNQYEKEGFDVIGYPSSYKLVKSVDGGKTFGDIITLDNQNCVCCQTSSLVGPDGEVYFAWRDLQYESDVKTTNTSDNPYNYGNANGTLPENTKPTTFETIRDIFIMHTTDNANGNEFSSPSKVSPDRWYLNACPDAGPGMSFDSKGRLHVAWFTGSETAPDGLGYYYAYSDDSGQTFSKALPLLTDKEFIPPTMVSVAVDSSDNIWITFADQRSSDVVRYSPIEEGHLGKVHLVIIDKNQKTLFNGPVTSGAIHEFVDISATNNIAHMAWKDGRDAKFASLVIQ